MSRRAAWARVAASLVAVAALDQATKALVAGSLRRGERVNVFFGVDLTHLRNRGVAFGILSDGGGAVLVLTALALALLLAYFATHARTPHLWAPVGMVLGGAAGNLIDRARHGAVTDFIDPIAWPAFNLADAAIVAGVLGLFYVAEVARARTPAGARGSS